MKDINLSRKGFLSAGLGAAGLVIASKSFSQIRCDGETTAAQPLGPFFPNRDTPIDPIRENPDLSVPIHLANDNDLSFVNGRSGRAQGQIVYVVGAVTDTQCQPIRNASIVIWQAATSGRYNHTGDGENIEFRHPQTGAVMRRELDPLFQYWGRAISDSQGRYIFKTIVPGFYPADLDVGWYRPPHIHFLTSATGYQQLTTQLYFNLPSLTDNAWIQTLNSRDKLLQSGEISDVERAKLIVSFGEGDDPSRMDGLVGHFDLVLKR